MAAELPLSETLARYTADQTPYTLQVQETAPSQAPGGGKDINDLSDIHLSRPQVSPVPKLLLPMRAEKRFVPIDASALVGQLQQNLTLMGEPGKAVPTTSDFFVTAAKREFVDYVVVRIPHRGLDASGSSNPDLTAEYRFLINPQTAQVGRNTEDSQTFARGGWQFGVWGEGLIAVSMTGHTPGQYWSYGLTDGYAYFSESWRNLQQLVMVFENNGYWFEGEESNEGPLAPGYTRRRIKKHQDVQLVVGNFVWHGMFDEFSYTLDAEHPYRAEFRLTFLAWKERFRQSSPYPWGIRTKVERGHSYGAYAYPASEQALPPNGVVSVTRTTPIDFIVKTGQGVTMDSVVNGTAGRAPQGNFNSLSPAVQSVNFTNAVLTPSNPVTDSFTPINAAIEGFMG